MKTLNRYELPEKVLLGTQEYVLDLDLTNLYRESKSNGLVKLEAKTRRVRHLKINVLSRKLRQRTDLTIKPHQPSQWIFISKMN